MSRREPVTQERIKQFEEELKSLTPGLGVLDVPVMITDENANIFYMNSAEEEATGFSFSEARWKNPGDLWGGQMTKKFYKQMWREHKNKKLPWHGEIRNKRKDGTVYWETLHIFPIFGKQNDVQFFLSISPDVISKKDRGKFLEVISILGHQLKNPLTAIKWTLELLARSDGFTEKQQELLEDARRQGQYLTDLVSDLFVLAKVGGPRLTRQQIDLGEEVEAILKSMRVTYPKVSFSFKKEEGSFLINVNRQLASQVFANIIANAAEYCDQTAGRASVALKRDEEGFLFSCENNGLTVPQEDQSKIFTHFFRAANAQKVKEGGTGLGLYIVKMICDTFGWQVSLRSPVSDHDGTVFYVRIPFGRTTELEGDGSGKL